MPAHQKLPIRAVVIDDDPAVGQLVRASLMPLELAVETFTQARPAWERLAGRPAELIFVDMGLPDDDEAELIRQTCAARPEATVLALATFPERDQIEQALAAGAQGVVAKPLDPQALLEAVRAALRRVGLYETSEARFNRRLGRRIRELRVRRGLAQQTLAEAIGISPAQLSHIESGRTGTTVWRLARIAAALRMPLSELLEDL